MELDLKDYLNQISREEGTSVPTKPKRQLTAKQLEARKANLEKGRLTRMRNLENKRAKQSSTLNLTSDNESSDSEDFVLTKAPKRGSSRTVAPQDDRLSRVEALLEAMVNEKIKKKKAKAKKVVNIQLPPAPTPAPTPTPTHKPQAGSSLAQAQMNELIRRILI